jgi:drug/metabolite transporter (DMT)-like permease
MGSRLCNFAALSSLPLAEVKAISFVSPLLVTIFAVWLLKERVARPRWIAVVVGSLGTLFIVRPGSDMLSWASLLAPGTALCYSLSSAPDATRVVRLGQSFPGSVSAVEEQQARLAIFS